MNESWLSGSVWDRAAVRWKGVYPQEEEPFDIFAEFRSARKILVLPNDRVGGLFIGGPVYRAIRQVYPQAAIQLVVDERRSAIARQISFVDGVFTLPLDRSLWHSAAGESAEMLRKEGFDLAFCLGADCSFRMAYFCGSCGARLRVGFRRPGLNPFNVEIVPDPAGRYEGEQCLRMLRLLGIEGEGEVRWALAEDKARQVRERYLGEGGDRIVGIDMSAGEGGGLSGRQFDDIVGRVVERGVKALLFFSLAERKQVHYLKETYGNRVLLFEEDDLVGAAALLQGCRALISCNTDLLHLAISLQVPSVALFDEPPGRWIAPDSRQVHVVPTPDLRAVDIAQVVRALEAALGRSRPERI